MKFPICSNRLMSLHDDSSDVAARRHIEDPSNRKIILQNRCARTDSATNRNRVDGIDCAVRAECSEDAGSQDSVAAGIESSRISDRWQLTGEIQSLQFSTS